MINVKILIWLAEYHRVMKSCNQCVFSKDRTVRMSLGCEHLMRHMISWLVEFSCYQAFGGD